MSVRDTTLTLERVKDVWQLSTKDDYDFALRFYDFPSSEYAVDRILKAHERLQLMRERCLEFFECTSDEIDSFTRMDELYSQHMQCNFAKFLENKTKTLEDVQLEALDLLRRLPHCSVRLPDHGGPDTDWEDLEVASAMNTNVVRIALIAGLDQLVKPYATDTWAKRIVQTTAEYIEVASYLSATAESSEHIQRWLRVRAFLWTSWQRLILLLFHQVLAIHVERGGYEHTEEHHHILRTTFPTPDLGLEQFSKKTTYCGKADYMCNWAFELLRTQDVCIVADFRNFHKRYSSLFGHRPARCNPGVSEDNCDGNRPDQCRRFIKMTGVEDQSSHDLSCSGACEKLVWDELSYRESEGARAVHSELTNAYGGQLKYCAVSTTTLAVSHVWIAGMGGRPEDGMNSCLHKRFSNIAKQLGCESYWMDTPCVPAESELRKKAIRAINGVFARSAATIVCDRDLMDIDVENCDFSSESPDELTVMCSEQILVAILVCDWNVRAWTFLESAKGRQHLRLLCKNNAIVSFLDVVKIVHRFGNIDLSIFALSSPHLFPSRSYTTDEIDYLYLKPGDSTISISEAGTLLSYRPARRRQDEMVIWSLLVKETEEPYSDPLDFWKSRQGTRINTGFFMSSAPRLKESGYSWAPKTPNAARSNGEGLQSFYRAYDGEDTGHATVTARGLEAMWTCFAFPLVDGQTKPNGILGQLPWGLSEKLGLVRAPDPGLEASNYPQPFIEECHQIHQKYLRGYKYGLLLQPISAPNAKSVLQDISLALRPSSAKLQKYSFARQAVDYRGSISGTLMAVCGSNGKFESHMPDDRKPYLYSEHTTWPDWTWKGVYEWPQDVQLPLMRKHRVIIT